MLQPKEGEVVTIDNIRLLETKPKTTSPFNTAPPPAHGGYTVLGADLEVKDVDDLADKLKDSWVKPEDKGVEQVEADIQTEYEKLKRNHSKGRPGDAPGGAEGVRPGQGRQGVHGVGRRRPAPSPRTGRTGAYPA